MQIRFALLLLMVSLVGCSGKNDVSGTWKGRITLPATGKSLSDLEFSLAQKGEAVTGTMVFTRQGGKLPLTGTFREGRVTLASPLKNGLAVSLTGVMDIRGRISGEALLDYDTPQLGKRQDKAALEMTR